VNQNMDTIVHKLIVEDFYPGGKSLIVFGKVIRQNTEELVFLTGAGSQYTISKKKKFFLSPTNKIFLKKKRCTNGKGLTSI